MKVFTIATTADLSPKDIQDYIWQNLDGAFTLTVVEISGAESEKASLHTSLVAAVEGLRQPITIDDRVESAFASIEWDRYNQALDDTLTIINSIFKE